MNSSLSLTYLDKCPNMADCTRAVHFPDDRNIVWHNKHRLEVLGPDMILAEDISEADDVDEYGVKYSDCYCQPWDGIGMVCHFHHQAAKSTLAQYLPSPESKLY